MTESDTDKSVKKVVPKTDEELIGEHMSYRNYMRDVILGANDGLVSLFALVIGVAGGGQNPKIILLAGIAGTVAGAISMAIGEYISTKSQEEVFDAEVRVEKEHIRDYRDHEVKELTEFYREKGFEGELLEQVINKITSNEEIFLKDMMMTEFGIVEEERRSPLKATIIVGIAFLLGSALPVLPFFFVTTPISGIIIATILSTIGLFSIGGIKSFVTRSSIIKGGSENLVLGLAGALITYIIGFFVGINI